MNPTNLYGFKPQVGHTKYEYVASTILQEIALTSKNLQNWAILDSGASSHFILSTAPVVNKRVAEIPLKVITPYGDTDTVYPSHVAE